MRWHRSAIGICSAVSWVAVAVAVSAAQTVFQPPPLRQLLEDNDWVSLPTADKRMGPGSIIRVTRTDGAIRMQWLGDFRRCGITDKEFQYVRGKYPAIGVGESFAVSASVAANFIAKLGGTADYEKAGNAIMQIEASGGDAVDFLAFSGWLANSRTAQRMSRICSNFLIEDDTYLVTEAFRVSRASYGLLDKNGIKLAITGGAFGPPGSGSSPGAGSSSTLSVVDDWYFGVRHVKQLALLMIVPNPEPRTAPEADDLLRRLAP